MPMTAAYAPALTHGFEGFLDFLRDQEAGPAVLSPKRFSDVLSIDLQTLAGQAHVHRNTLSRAPASESVQRFMREALRVLRAAGYDVTLAETTVGWWATSTTNRRARPGWWCWPPTT